MSVQAVSWAFAAPISDSTEKFVLVAISNYADEFGVCWPSQATLIAHCSCSERKLRDCLKSLDARGFIKRVARWRPNGSRRSDAVLLIGFSGRRLPCSPDEHPILALFDPVVLPEFANRAEASLTICSGGNGAAGEQDLGDEDRCLQGDDADHNRQTAPVINRQDAPVMAQHLVAGGDPQDTNRHGVPPLNHQLLLLLPRMSASEAEAACLAACGSGLSEDSRRAVAVTAHVIDDWLDAGFDLGLDVLPVLRNRTARPRAGIVRTWDYFSAAIRQAHAQRMRREERAASTNGGARSVGRVAPEPAVADPVSGLQVLADWINSGRHIPPSAVNNTKRDALLAAGLVTPERLRQLQIY